MPVPTTPEGARDVEYGGDPLAAAQVRPGEIVSGKYRIERVLGAGGMGVVVAAYHIQLDEKVALKFLLPETLSNSDAVSRFVREARAAVKIKSEHIARVTDVGMLPNGAPYMVMEYLEGGDLADWLKQRGALPVAQAVEFILQACVAVADAHALGIVHRDLKPANLFCVRRSDGQLSIKVLDFGISKMTEASGMGPITVTRTSSLMGSPFYMSPEQMRSSRDVDARTDIWSLGIILFELVTGRLVFRADTVTELAIQVANEPTPPIRTFRPDVPGALEAVVFKCLEKDKEDRYRNVAELAMALLPFAPRRARALAERISGIVQAAGLSASALDLPPSPQPGADSEHMAETAAPLGATASGMVSGTKAIAGIAVLVGLGLGVGVATWFARRPTSLPIRVQTSAASAHDAPTASIAAAPAEPEALPAAPQPGPDSVTPPPAVANDAAAARSGATTSRGPASARPPARGAAAASCRIVSSFDKDGNEHFQQVCK